MREASREAKEDRVYALSLLPTVYSVCLSTEQAARLRGAGRARKERRKRRKKIQRIQKNTKRRKYDTVKLPVAKKRVFHKFSGWQNSRRKERKRKRENYALRKKIIRSIIRLALRALKTL